MTYCTKCGKPTNNGIMCEDCIISDSPWLLAMNRKEDDLVEQIEQLKAENAALKEQKDRAEVAEKALDLCETAYILSLNHRATEGISGQAIASDLGVHKFFIKQAEKELAEEEKDD